MNRSTELRIAPACGIWWVEDDDPCAPEIELLVLAAEPNPCPGHPLEHAVRALRRGIGGEIDG